MSAPKVILVTGASSGIGRACAGLLHGQAHVVYGGNRDPGSYEAPWRKLALDVTDDASVAGAISRVLGEHGRIDALVNNAGAVYAGAVEDTSIAEARAQFEVNFFGAMRLCKAVLPSMRVQKSGLIVNMSSLAGLMGLPFQGLYCASKFALEGLTESLRMEVAAFGVDVVLLEPGDIATNVVANRARVAAAGQGSVYRENFEKVVAVFEAEERGGASPDSVAREVARLVEDANRPVRRMTGAPAQRLLTGLKRVLPARFWEKRLMGRYGLRR